MIIIGKERENSYRKTKTSPDGEAGGTSVDRIVGAGERASEGLGLYGTGFIVGSLARKGAGRGMGSKVSSDKELTEVGRMAEGD